MTKKLYAGQLVMDLITIVDEHADETVERDLAHEAIDFELLNDVKALIVARGYYSECIGFNLRLEGYATKPQIETIEQKVKEARSREDEVRGITRVTTIRF